MPRAQAYKFAAQAVLGSAKMVLETGKHPAELEEYGMLSCRNHYRSGWCRRKRIPRGCHGRHESLHCKSEGNLTPCVLIKKKHWINFIECFFFMKGFGNTNYNEKEPSVPYPIYSITICLWLIVYVQLLDCFLSTCLCCLCCDIFCGNLTTLILNKKLYCLRSGCLSWSCFLCRCFLSWSCCLLCWLCFLSWSCCFLCWLFLLSWDCCLCRCCLLCWSCCFLYFFLSWSCCLAASTFAIVASTVAFFTAMIHSSVNMYVYFLVILCCL